MFNAQGLGANRRVVVLLLAAATIPSLATTASSSPASGLRAAAAGNVTRPASLTGPACVDGLRIALPAVMSTPCRDAALGGRPVEPLGSPLTPAPGADQTACGPVAAGVNDECPEWVSGRVPDVASAGYLQGAAAGAGSQVQDAVLGDSYFATRPATMSPDGGTLYAVGSCDGGDCGPTADVTGQDKSRAGAWGFLTAAYDARTGALKWVRGFNSGGQYEDAASVAASATTVFSLAYHGSCATCDAESHLLATATNGQRRWRLMLPHVVAYAEALSADGHMVYVAGSSFYRPGQAGCRLDATVSAVDAAAGRVRWTRVLRGQAGDCSRSQGAPRGSLLASDVAYGGGRVGLAYGIFGAPGDVDRLGVAVFDARTGRQVSRGEYTPPPSGEDMCGDGTTPGVCVFHPGHLNTPNVVMSRDGRRLVVTTWCNCREPDGYAHGAAAVVSFDVSTGKIRWQHVDDGGGAARYMAPWVDQPLALSADGREVVVTGLSVTATKSSDADGLVTSAYATDTGRRLWTERYSYSAVTHATGCLLCGPSIGVVGGTVVVSGYINGGYNGGQAWLAHPWNAMVGYDLKTGRQKWVALDQPWDRSCSWTYPDSALVADARNSRAYSVMTLSPDCEHPYIQAMGYAVKSQ